MPAANSPSSEPAPTTTPSPPDIADVAWVFALYGLPAPRSLTPLSGGYANWNFRVDTERGVFLYRICRSQGEDAVRHELQVMDLLRPIDFPTAYPLRRRDGERTVATEAGLAVLYPFVEGHPPQPSPQAAAEVGRALAALHNLPGGVHLKRTHYADLDACAQLAADEADWGRAHPAVWQAFTRQTEDLTDALSLPLPRGLLHGDVFPDNTIFRGYKLAALVDFEDSALGTLLFDLGVALNGFAYDGQDLRADLARSLLSAYHRLRPLSDEERALVPDYLSWGTLAMLFWHLNQLVRRPDERQLKRARYLAERIKSLRAMDRRHLRQCLAVDGPGAMGFSTRGG